MVPLRADRTYFVSLDKTKHSRAEVLISVALRGWVGVRLKGEPNFSINKINTFCALPDSKMASENDSQIAFVR